jgi:hypothetical protein
MNNVVDSIPGIEKLNKATQSEPAVGLNLKDGMSIEFFNKRRVYKNRTQVIDYEYYTSNQYLAHNYRLFMKQNQPNFTTNDLIKNLLFPKIKKKHLKLKLTPFQKFEIEKQNKQRKLNQIKSSSSIHNSIQLTISSSKSCSSEKSLFKTAPLSKSNNHYNYNKTILKKKLVLFPDIVQKYKIVTANTHVFNNIQQTSYKNKKINLFLTNMKY